VKPAFVEPGKPRARVLDDGVTLRLEIRPRAVWPVRLLLPFWLVGWLAGFVFAVFQLITEHDAFLALWLVLWTGFGASTYRFGQGIDEAEARDLARLIEARFPAR
jgi:hypothetical protein